MIKRIFIYISRKLNIVIRFINLKILKRKKAITVVDFLYLVFSKFQETKLFKLLVFIYKIFGIFLALISFGAFYKENYNLNDVNHILGQIKDTIISIYNILYNTIILIFNIIFRRENIQIEEEDSNNEPYEDYYISDTLDYLFKEETPWYQDWYIISGIIFFLFCIGVLTYSNWNSDSNIKENIQSMGSDFFNILKDFKNKIINFFMNRRRNQGDEDNSNEDSSSETNSYFRDEMDISRIDSRILTDPYLYPFFKYLHKKEDWPMYGSSEHDKMISETFNPTGKKLIHTYEHITNLYDSIVNMANNKAKLPESMVDNFQNIMDKASEEYYTWKNFNDANLPPTETTPKASTSILSDTTPKPLTSILPENKPLTKLEEINEKYKKEMEKFNNPNKPILNENTEFHPTNLNETTILSNLKGKFTENKSIFEGLRIQPEPSTQTKNEPNNLVNKAIEIIKSTDELINDNGLDTTLFKDTAYDLEIDNIPSAPPAPPAPSISSSSTLEDNKQPNSNPLLNSINNFSKNRLKKATTITKKVFDRQGNILDVVSETTGEENNPLDIIPNLVNQNPTSEIDDLKSDIWKKTFRREGFEINDEGIITKTEASNSQKVTDNNPLTLKLSEQLEKMKFSEIPDDTIKKAPSWTDENIPKEAPKPQTQNLIENEVEEKMKTRKKRIKKSTGLTKNYDPNDPNVNLEKLYGEI